jgi:hypothetical protein
MSGGEINGNIASSSGGGVYVGGTFTMSGGAQVNLNNPVYLADPARFVSIGSGGFTSGTDPVALVEPAANIGFIGKPALQWAAGGSGVLPEDRFIFPAGWSVDTGGILNPSALPLAAPGEEAGAYLSRGQVHFYRFTPDLSGTYTITHTRPNGSGIYAAAGWADGSGTLVTSTSTSGTNITSSSFVANKTGVDIIIMVYNGSGAYTVRYNKQ